ncbi:Eukaryotic translation initiation factor 3 subunit B [Diplonema papillatum]|nr:Eukaryotic translation initiation factor 3 subunit B [Diplonema papillatum]|eukprot:gene6348-9727_t
MAAKLPRASHPDPRVAQRIETTVDKSKDALVIVDNIPKVELTRLKKLTEFLKRKIQTTASLPTSIDLPQDEDGTTLGFCFVAFESKEIAEDAMRKLNNLRMDKNHLCKTNMFSDWERYKDTPEEHDAPQLEMDKFCEENLYEYLCDEGAREQFFIRYGAPSAKKDQDFAMQIYWNDFQVLNATDQPNTMKQIHSRTNWTKMVARWSRLGTYLVTCSEKGLSLWGGQKWTAMGQFPHNEVRYWDWSKKEKYLITWGSELIVWDVQLGKKIRRVQVPFTGPGTECPFKWSHDEQFLAKLSEDNILLYDLEKGMKLCQPDPDRVTTLYMPGIKCLEWSPTDNYFCYWVPESGNTPARVTIVEVETNEKKDGTKSYSFNTIAQRNLYRVQNIRMTWHPQGDFLACKVERIKKSQAGNTTISAYELFRIRHKDRAVETIELPEQVIAFDFEPRGHRFALIHGPSDVKLSVSFYTMGGVHTGQVKLLGTFQKKEVNHMYWSPKGKYVLLAGMKQPFNGKTLEFWNVDDLDLINTCEHFMCSNVAWDASGRFVTTFASHAYTQMENGFKMWTFQGKLVTQEKFEKFYQFEWRTRPPSLLSDKDVKMVKTKLRPQWEKKYAEEEAWILEKDEREKRERMQKEWKSYKDRINEIKKQFAKQTEERKRLQIDAGACYDFKMVTVTQEEVVDLKEQRYTD